jgi:hypothetical protein
MPPRSTDSSADKQRVRAIRDRLRNAYGRPITRPHRQPIDTE